MEKQVESYKKAMLWAAIILLAADIGTQGFEKAVGSWPCIALLATIFVVFVIWGLELRKP